MLKALMPVSVFTVGCLFGMESYNPRTLVNMVVITIGVVIASYGEINFVVIGVLLQLASVATESTRLMLIQILLQRRGLSLNPVTTMYYIAPASFTFLSIPFVLVSPLEVGAKARRSWSCSRDACEARVLRLASSSGEI